MNAAGPPGPLRTATAASGIRAGQDAFPDPNCQHLFPDLPPSTQVFLQPSFSDGKTDGSAVSCPDTPKRYSGTSSPEWGGRSGYRPAGRLASARALARIGSQVQGQKPRGLR